MNNYVKEFFKRGLMFSGFGPIIIGIVYLVLNYTNKDLTKENLALKYQIEDLISLYPDIENDIIFG